MIRHRRPAFPTLAAALAIVLVPDARAADLLAPARDLIGPYIGAGVGQGDVDTANLAAPPSVPNAGSFAENHSAYKLLAGLKMISLLGAEIEYLDLGHPSRSYYLVGSGPTMPVWAVRADVKLSGGGVFGMLYLPVPLVSFYVKGGVARLQATSNVIVTSGIATCPINNPNCALMQNSVTNTRFAAGAGLQAKLGQWAVRAEYERFSAAGGSPSLATLGVLWAF